MQWTPGASCPALPIEVIGDIQGFGVRFQYGAEFRPFAIESLDPREIALYKAPGGPFSFGQTPLEVCNSSLLKLESIGT